MQALSIVILVLLAGAMLPMQAMLNSRLGKALGSAEYASFVSFLIGAMALLLYLLIVKTRLSTLTQTTTLPWYVWMGGVLGAFYVAVVIILAPRLGTAFTFGLVIAGQMLISVSMDHVGFMGLEVKPINYLSILGLVLLGAGVFLIRKA